ncbi:MAG: peptidase M20, partial [Opitutales bacterium]|nr:peptidase M20 [Opitutales bacterium]
MKFEIVDFISKLVSFKSVSADSNYADEVRKCAEFLTESLCDFGFSAKLHNTKLHPIIFAERKCKSGSPKIRILCYGHYDVQPIDPIEKW